MTDVRIVEITDEESFALLPPCADSRFDHRTCDYWEDADRGSKLHRPGWLQPERPQPARPRLSGNPFAGAVDEDDPGVEVDELANPFLAAARTALPPAFADDDLFRTPLDNPFAPTEKRERPRREGVPRKLGLLDRGRGIFGSYAKVLLVDGQPVAYCQFGPLSAYPRARRLRELYSQLPEAPLPAVITCIATTADARREGHAERLLEDVCVDLAGRGFAAIESYPDLTRGEDEQSGGRPELWRKLGFAVAVDDERFPVMRREL